MLESNLSANQVLGGWSRVESDSAHFVNEWRWSPLHPLSPKAKNSKSVCEMRESRKRPRQPRKQRTVPAAWVEGLGVEYRASQLCVFL